MTQPYQIPDMRWQHQIPNITDENVYYSVIWVNSEEAHEHTRFDENIAEIREVARTDAECRARYREAYEYLLAYQPTTRQWSWATDTLFCTRAHLLEYLQAFVDYVFGDRPAPLTPPLADEPCGHNVDARGICVLAAAEWAAEDAEAAETKERPKR